MVNLVDLVILVTNCIICTLQNFQFCLAHLWTDFQSCFLQVGERKAELGKVRLQADRRKRGKEEEVRSLI